MSELGRSGRIEADVVLVDDDHSVHVFLERQLRAGPHTLTAFDDAEAALTWLRTRRPRVLIVDYRLPGTDGRTLIDALGGAAAAAAHTVLCTSGGRFGSAGDAAQDSPGNATLEQIDKAELFDRVRFRDWLTARTAVSEEDA